jgi:hypothetical protein
MLFDVQPKLTWAVFTPKPDRQGVSTIGRIEWDLDLTVLRLHALPEKHLGFCWRVFCGAVMHHDNVLMCVEIAAVVAAHRGRIRVLADLNVFFHLRSLS